jgi:hypothetical protein
MCSVLGFPVPEIRDLNTVLTKPSTFITDCKLGHWNGHAAHSLFSAKCGVKESCCVGRERDRVGGGGFKLATVSVRRPESVKVQQINAGIC